MHAGYDNNGSPARRPLHGRAAAGPTLPLLRANLPCGRNVLTTNIEEMMHVFHDPITGAVLNEDQLGWLSSSGILKGPDREQALEMLLAATNHAREQQGAQAFKHPKRDAAIHEAGHCVVSAYMGWQIRYVELRSGPQGSWCGWTEGVGIDYALSTHSPLEEDLPYLLNIMAGFVAEELFLPDPRMGSSLDEKIGATFYSEIIAPKLGLPPLEMWAQAKAQVADILDEHRATVLTIANRLEHRHKIQSKKLTQILQSATTIGRKDGRNGRE
jgi:hypothetical protein